jgi:hypothetical protein
VSASRSADDGHALNNGEFDFARFLAFANDLSFGLFEAEIDHTSEDGATY